ncbi:MAG: outer membrane beta-barrel protein, partial [Flavobacterium sp.]
MKKIVLSAIVTVLSVSALIAQEVKENTENLGKEFNQWSVDINAGVNKPTTPFAQGYYTSSPSLFHADLGVRYMFNNKFGIKADFGYDQLKNHDDSLEFDGQYYRTSLQGVLNIGRLLNFEDWTQRLNLQAHAGPGYSFMKNDAYEGNDNMANFMLGLTGQIKLTERI